MLNKLRQESTTTRRVLERVPADRLSWRPHPKSMSLVGEDLVVSVGAERWAKGLAKPHVRPMDFTGKAMKGFVYVGPAGIVREDR